MKLALICSLSLMAVSTAMAGDSVRDPAKPGQRVRALIMDTAGKQVGTATFVSTPAGVKVTVEARGLPPGLHGAHVHEKGVCDPQQQFKSSGDHFAPSAKGHGLLSDTGPHAGDLPNLKVKSDGTARLKATLQGTSLNPADPNSLLRPGGTAFIVHAGPDDQATDPSGKSGDRIACAVIASAKS